MSRKEIITEGGTMTVIDILENVEIAYWIGGGWGVGILAGKQTRDRRDIDTNFGPRYTGKLLHMPFEYGCEIDTDWKPVRMELCNEKYGYLDIHPLILHEDGTARQASLEGDWCQSDKDLLGSSVFEGRTIPCISMKEQKLFHSGYELRDEDRHDVLILECMTE